MMLGVLPGTDPSPRRGRALIPAGLPRRREALALFAATLVAGHLVFAPVTLVVAIVLAVTGRMSRWRPWWLLIPAAVGLAFTLARGPGIALAHFTAWPSGIIGLLHQHLASHPAAHPGHPAAGFRVAWSALPGQLPLAIICGAAEAAVLGWLAWLHTDEWAVPAPRPGALAAVRALYAGATIRTGAVLTRDGCALGVEPATGAVAELRWAEMSGGLLITGDDPRDVALASLQVVHAALRRRKPLIVFDQGEGSSLGRALTAACLATGTPLRMDGPDAGFPAADGGADTTSGTDGASASRLWGRAREVPSGSPQGVRAAVDLHHVITERSAARLPADSAEMAARACADLTALARHLRAIGVDGDGLIWIPHGEHVRADDLAALLGEASAAGLQVLVGSTPPAAAADLAGLAGATLLLRVADPALASQLADLTGSRLLPASAAVPVQPGVPAMPGVDLVRCPVVPPWRLRALRPGEFVLAVNAPHRRLIALGQLVPARLPPRTESLRAEPPPWEIPRLGERW